MSALKCMYMYLIIECWRVYERVYTYVAVKLKVALLRLQYWFQCVLWQNLMRVRYQEFILELGWLHIATNALYIAQKLVLKRAKNCMKPLQMSVNSLPPSAYV